MSNTANKHAYPEESSAAPEPVDILLEKLAAKLSEIEFRPASTNGAHRIPPDVPRFITRW